MEDWWEIIKEDDLEINDLEVIELRRNISIFYTWAIIIQADGIPPSTRVLLIHISLRWLLSCLLSLINKIIRLRVPTLTSNNNKMLLQKIAIKPFITLLFLLPLPPIKTLILVPWVVTSMILSHLDRRNNIRMGKHKKPSRLERIFKDDRLQIMGKLDRVQARTKTFSIDWGQVQAIENCRVKNWSKKLREETLVNQQPIRERERLWKSRIN